MRTILTLGLLVATFTSDTDMFITAEKLSVMWSIAEVRIIVERCKYAHVDERAVAEAREAARIDLKESVEDRSWYDYYKDDRRNMLWVKSDDQVCLRGYLLYGPGAWPKDRLLIYDPSWK